MQKQENKKALAGLADILRFTYHTNAGVHSRCRYMFDQASLACMNQHVGRRQNHLTFTRHINKEWNTHAKSSNVPVDEVSFSVYELHQLTGQAAVKLLGSKLDMQQHIQPL